MNDSDVVSASATLISDSAYGTPATYQGVAVSLTEVPSKKFKPVSELIKEINMVIMLRFSET